MQSQMLLLYQSLSRRRKRQSLDLEHFKHILDQNPNVVKISLVGIGESFMNKHLWRIVAHAKSRGIEIGTTSNGTFMNDDILKNIFDSGLDWLNFSLDGATKETYEKLRPGAHFETVLENIRRVSGTTSGRSRPVLAVWFLSTSENIHELSAMVPLVKSLGIPSLNTQGVHYWGHEDWHGKADEANAISQLSEILRSVKNQAQKAGISFQWYNFPSSEPKRGCKWPWKGSYITADGFVTPCCANGSDPDKINFGNLFERSYEEIWNSKAYQDFRHELKSQTARPSICQDCPTYHETLKVDP